MSDTAFCQSCLMPLESEQATQYLGTDAKGTNADGTKSDDYCTYCYQNGEFTQDMTMDQMIDHNLQYLDEWNASSGLNLTPDEARAQLQTLMPTLKRWQTT